MSKRIAVHFDSGKKFIGTTGFASYIPCLGVFVFPGDYHLATNPSKVTCKNCRRTSEWIAASGKEHVDSLRHITGKPVRSPFPHTGTYKILCRGSKSWSPSTACVVVMGHDVNPKTEGGWSSSEVVSRHE